MTTPQQKPSTLLDLIRSAPASNTAIIIPEQNISITYGGLRDQVEALAETLAGAGVRRGDRVGIALPNGLPTIVAFLAASMAGTAAPLNPGYKEEEFRFYLEDTSARVLLLPPDGADDARRAAGSTVPVFNVVMDAAGTVSLQNATERKPIVPPSVDDVALILHTSGSTGRPKRVPLSHANLSISAGNIARHYKLTDTDVSLCVMPLFHVHGLVASTLATLYSGGTVVVPGKFNPLSFWRGAKDHGATWYSAVPTIHQLLLARADAASGPPAGAEKLRFIRSCSAALPPALMEGIEKAFGAPVLEAYGMTEAAHQMASNPLPPAAHKGGSVGQGSDVKVSIMDQKGNHLKQGERGEVVIKGPNVTSGYESNPEANATSFVDGWFRTGDEGILDAEGYLTLVGRIKELINRGGEKISPREIDEVLLTHPCVAEAVSFGLPHKMWGEEVAAAVVLKDPATEATLLAFCKERLADFKRPKQIFITEAIPRTATGKIQRRVVAQVYSEQEAGRSAVGGRQQAVGCKQRGQRTDVRIVIAGAGAIGGYIGAKLAKAGADVTLFARGPHLKAMQERGLRVVSHDGDFEVKPQVTGDLQTIGTADVVILGDKAHALTTLAPQLRQLFGPDTVVVSTQNGIPWWYFQGLGGELDGVRLERVDPGGVIAASIEPRRVIGSLAYFATDITEPGVIHHAEGNRLTLGEPDGTKSDRVRAIAEALIASGLRCPISTKFRQEIWVKLMGNVAFQSDQRTYRRHARGKNGAAS